MSALARSILVATDFSQASELAIEAAALLAKQNQASLTVVHVYVPLPSAPMVEDPKTGLLMADDFTRKELHGRLDELAKRKLADIPNVKLAVMASQSAADGICHYAEHEDCDMIVISTHGRTGLARMLIGSVAERVVRHAHCPVLTLRSKAPR